MCPAPLPTPTPLPSSWLPRLPPRRLSAALLTTVAALVAALAAGLAHPSPAAAHDMTSTAYVEVEGTGARVEATLDLECDLLMKSAWLYAEAYEAKDHAEQLHQLTTNAGAVTDYVTGRFAVTHDGKACTPRRTGDADIRTRGTRPFAVLTLAYDCAGGCRPSSCSASPTAWASPARSASTRTGLGKCCCRC